MPTTGLTSGLTSGLTGVSRRYRRVRRAVLAHRRLLAALCAALAVLATVRANATPPPPRTSVLTAAHDLAAGVVVRPQDLRRVPFDPSSVPRGVVDATTAVGRTTAGPIRAGEPVTDVRLVTSSVLAGYPGLVGVPVRIGDAAAVRLLRVGDRVDLVAADPQGERPAGVVAHDVPVLAIPRAVEDSAGPSAEGAALVLGLPRGAVPAVVQATVSSYLSVVIVR
jgi:Flp pilus assembly protein CpaB